MPRQDQSIVIVDGACNFYNGAVQLISSRDPRGSFLFSLMQSDCAQTLAEELGITNVSADTVRIVPVFFRDFVYRLFARYGQSLFSKADQCQAPPENIQSRFLGTWPSSHRGICREGVTKSHK